MTYEQDDVLISEWGAYLRKKADASGGNYDPDFVDIWGQAVRAFILRFDYKRFTLASYLTEEDYIEQHKRFNGGGSDHQTSGVVGRVQNRKRIKDN